MCIRDSLNSTSNVKSVKRHLVLPLNADKVHVEPTDGFNVGDMIVVAGQSGLKENSLIRELGDPLPGETNSVSAAVKTNSPALLSTNAAASATVTK